MGPGCEPSLLCQGGTRGDQYCSSGYIGYIGVIFLANLPVKAAVFCQSLVTAVYIVLLSDVLIQEAPNSASSSRVSPTTTTRDAFRLSRRRALFGEKNRFCDLASVRH